jgi:hypothetical protein
MHSPAHDDRCKDYVLNAYLTGEEYFAVDCVQNRNTTGVRACATGFSKLELSRRVSAAPAVSATPDSIRLSGSAQSGNAKRDRQRHSQICREGVRLCV